MNQPKSAIQRYAAEFIAVLALTLTVSLSISADIDFAFATPIAAAFTLGLFIYTIGPISGGHINPAITLGLFLNGKHSLKDTIGYLIAQFAGAAVTMYTLKLVNLSPEVVVANTYDMGIIELMGTFFLAFGVASVVWGKATKSASGIVIGGSLFLGIITASAAGSAGILNPAVAVGLGAANWYYILGPILGAYVATALYSGLARD